MDFKPEVTYNTKKMKAIENRGLSICVGELPLQAPFIRLPSASKNSSRSSYIVHVFHSKEGIPIILYFQTIVIKKLKTTAGKLEY